MMQTDLKVCPRCGEELAGGFATRASGLSFTRFEKLKQWAFQDEDLAKAGIRSIVPWKAEYFRSWICESCHLYLVDYHKILTRDEVNRIAGC